ncbi:MAG: T9SS type A sorting domain-containing protein [Saprospirales bacterium]|nr:T9SS type A sorting domain-containing protein [Saprospirales bacterium]
MNNMRSFFFLLASFLFSFSLQAQTPICLDFEEIPIGTIYSAATGFAPGDLIFTEESVDVSVGAFDLGNGDTTFGSTVALDVPPNFTIGNGVVLVTNNMNLSFDFSGVSGPLLGIAFGFLDGGGLENFSVNGGDLFVVESFSELPAVVAPGVMAQVIFLPGVVPPVGTVILSGNVTSLTVGGQELVLDNFCFLIEEPNPDCALANLTAIPQDCDGTGHFETLINFDHVNNSTAGFNLFLDGQLYDSYLYANLPVTLGPLFGDGLTGHSVEIIDLANPDCNISTEFGPVDCSTDCLQFEGLETGTVFGAATGNDPGDLIFTEAGVPVSVQEFDNGNGLVTFGNVLVENDPFQNYPSIDDNYLFTSNINLVFDFTGVGTDVYAVRFGFAEHGGVINLQVNEGTIHIIEHFAGLPFEVAPGVTATVQVESTPNGTWGWVLLEGPIEMLMVGGQELTLDNFCYFQQLPCDIYDLVAQTSTCNADGQYNLYLNFQVQNPGNDFFNVDYNGQTLGTFPISELPIGIENFSDNGEQVVHVTVCINDMPDCCQLVEFPSPCPASPCNIYDLTAETTPCENGMFYVVLNFQYENVGNQGFKVQGNGVMYGTFGYGDLPVTIGPLVGDGTTVYEFAVKDVAHPDCQDVTFAGPVDCGGGPCEIYDLTAQTSSCNADGQYNLYLNFQVQNPGNNFFNVFYDGQSLGTFPLSELPLGIENFSDNGEQVVHVTVCINDMPDCRQLVEFPSPCPASPCNIYDLTAETTPCENGQFYVVLNFQYENVGGEGFHVVGNGNNYGNFEYSQLPITLGPFLGDGTTVYEFGISDLLHPDCHAATFIDPVDCGGSPCAIYDLVVETSECNGDGAYNLYINFQVDNPGNDFFEVFYNDQNIGYFALADLPVVIENFQDNGEQVVHISVCINDVIPHCCKVAEFLSPCPASPCNIYDLTAETTPCENGMFYVVLNFQYENVGNQGFKVQGNGVMYGTFGYGDLPVTIGPLVGDGTTVYEFAVKDVAHPDCQDVTFIDPVDCGGGPCEIYDLTAQTSSCNADGQYNLYLNFQVQNPGNNFFNVFYDGQSLGTFPISELPLGIENFSDNGEQVVHVTVCINDMPDCCKVVEFLSPCPASPCNIYDLTAETTPCENGQFYVILNFQYENVGGEGFHVVGNGNNYGNFEYSQLPITLGPFLGDGTTVYEFGVSDLLHPDCHAATFIDPVDCGGSPCAIYDLVVETSECNGDGAYNLYINFQVDNPGNDFFEVFYNDQNIGYFALADLPVVIENFQDNGEQVVHISVCINDVIPHCCKVAEFLSPCPASPCNIYDLTAETTPCENGMFYVVLNFQYENVGNQGFKVQGNGVMYGTFGYGDLPVTIGPLVGDGTTVYEFAVKDVAHPDCHEVTFAGPVDCGGGPCEIYDLVAQTSSCNADGQYNLYLNFQVQNPGNNFFNVFYNGQSLGTFPISELPIGIENFSDNGEQVVHVTVCINDMPDCCKVVEFLSPCPEGNVWPGDANADNIANNIDMLNLGMAYGATGPARSVVSINWQAWSAMNWTETFPNGVNFKHADCDGTGSIDAIDQEAIELNYSETHGTPLPVEYSEGTEEDPPLYADLPEQGQVGAGDAFEIPIILGTHNLPIDDIYGIAFTMHFNPDLIDPASVNLEYPNSWMGVSGVNMIVLDKKFVEEGIIDVALSRIDGNNVSGYGQIMSFIGIIDDVLGKHEMKIEFSKVRAIMFNDELIDLQFPEETIIISSLKEMAPQTEGLKVFPNPSHEEIRWTLSSNHQCEYAAVIDVNGRVLAEQFGPKQTFSLGDLPAGMYWLKVQAGDQVFISRFVKM